MDPLVTKRLILREMEQGDLPALSRLLQDDAARYAFDRTFTPKEAANRLFSQRESYKKGYGMLAAAAASTGELLGEAGLYLRPFLGDTLPTLACLFRHDHWHLGLGQEACEALLAYGFEKKQLPAIYAMIKGEDMAGKKLARKLSMELSKSFRVKDQMWLLYRIKREQYSIKT